MKRRFRDLPVIYLHPGEFHFSKNPEVVTTVLGSCISVTMHVSRLKLSAITHAMMPEATNCDINDDKNPYKYVSSSIQNMIGLFTSYNVDPSEIEVKIFGGADQFRIKNESGNEDSVGAKNIRMALEILSDYNFSITASDLGGSTGRKLFFMTETGDIFLKRFKKNEHLKKSNSLR